MFDEAHEAVETVRRSGFDRGEPLEFSAAGRLARAIEDGAQPEGREGDPDLPQIGDYLIDRRLGQGGGGVVYHGLLPGWNDEFAIKLLHRPVGQGPAARRAQRELNVLERLDLPGTPRVFEYGEHEGRLFIVSEHVQGLPLDRYCREHGLDRRARVALLVRVARVVDAMHERGVLHRDLKPGNILIRPGGEPVIIDLGIATVLGENPVETVTADVAAIGSIRYMAPEQARGETRAISTRSDVYGLGATACEILTGRTPHEVGSAGPLEAIHAVGHEPGRAPRQLDRGLPAPLAAVLERALASDPAGRFSSVAAFADDLGRWIEGRPVRSQRSSWWRNRWLAVRRHPARWAWGTAACLAVVGMGTVAAAAEVRRLDERLDLLDQLEAKQAFIDKHHAIVAEASRNFLARINDGKFRESLQLMQILEDNVNLGIYEEGDARIEEIRHNTDRFLAEVLRAVYAGRQEPPTDRELAMNAVRATYEARGAWKEEVGTAIESLLETLE